MRIRRMPTFLSWLNEDQKLTVAVVILFHNDKMLTLHRGPTAPWEPNRWDLPGGTVEQGEDIKNAAIRECYEETKIIPQNIRRLHKKLSQ